MSTGHKRLCMLKYNPTKLLQIQMYSVEGKRDMHLHIYTYVQS